MTSPIPASFEIGDIRVQPLGPHLVRVEQRGPAGFEDRETFTVQARAVGAVAAGGRVAALLPARTPAVDRRLPAAALRGLRTRPARSPARRTGDLLIPARRRPRTPMPATSLLITCGFSKFRYAVAVASGTAKGELRL